MQLSSLKGHRIVVTAALAVFASHPPYASGDETPVSGRGGAERRAAEDAAALALVAQWNQSRTVEIASDDLDPAVAVMPYSESTRLPSGAVPIDGGDLPQPSKDDLDEAIVGLLRAYEASAPDSIVDYMKERGQRFNPAYRKFLEGALSKRDVVSDLSTLIDEDLYEAMWTIFKIDPHWHGLVIDASVRRAWHSGKVPIDRLKGFAV